MNPLSSLFRAYSDLPFLFGPACADPYNAAGNGFQRIIVGNDFDGLSASQFAKIPAKSEAVLRAIDDQTGKSFGLPSKVSDNAGASCLDYSFGTAAVGNAKGAHSLSLQCEYPRVPSHIA